MRSWVRAELTQQRAPAALGYLFCFASVTPPLEPRALWFDLIWYSPYEDEAPTALLAAG